MNRFLGRALWATAAAAATAATAFGQVVSDAVPLLSQQHILDAPQSGWQPAGPGDFHRVPSERKFSTFSTDPRDSVLFSLDSQPEIIGGTRQAASTNPGGIQQGDIAGGGGGTRFISQDPSCTSGWFSNNNHASNPYLVFDDFRAGSEPLRNVQFYAGIFGGTGSLNEISTIGVEIWSTQASGDTCGWTYASLAGRQTYAVSEVSPTFFCTGDLDFYEMTANFDTPIALNPGEIYMVLVYATLVDPNGSGLFAWCQSDMSNFRDATSWDRTTGDYIRCSPDMAFTTNVGSDCFELDCAAPDCYFSNFTNNNNPFIAADDFVAPANTDLRQLQFTGGGWNVGAGTPTLLGNTAGFYIELYNGSADGNQDCGVGLGTFLGAYQVTMADARPVFQCIDAFGIPLYEFTVNIPANVYALTAGNTYILGVYGIPADPNDPELFCWGLTDAIYGLNSYSFNLDDGSRSCHQADHAFCINGGRPCLGDFNMDGVRNTQDVLAFLNAWNAGLPAADINGDGVINTQDVLAFLNRWNIPC